jgi:outer membrane protein assembly factor BamB
MLKSFTPLVLAVLVFPVLSQRCSAQSTITLSRKIGPPTSTLSVSGTGFQPDIGVDIYFDNHDEALAVTDANGQFSPTRIAVPPAATPGRHLISAIGRNSGGAAQSRFVVNTDWSQVGFSPAQTNSNPYENVLNTRNVNRLDLLWFTYFGSDGNGPESSPPTSYEGRVYVTYVGPSGELDAINELTGVGDWSSRFSDSPAAISDGVVYSVSDNGYLDAIDALTGSLIWQFSFNTDKDYPPTPPVATDGKVFFGTLPGNFYAVDQRTGQLLWSLAPQGVIQSVPAVLDGTVYYCAGNCYAYDENGFFFWQYSASSNAAPAVSGGTVVVNNAAGTTALGSATGTVIWQYSAPGPETAPAIADGIVFVTRSSGTIALNAVTGQLIWSVPIISTYSPTVANGVVYISDFSNSTLYALEAASGKPLWLWQFAESVIVSSPSVINGMVYVNTVNLIEGYGVLNAFGLATAVGVHLPN